MFNQVATSGERFTTFLAFIRLFSRVDFPMCGEELSLLKDFPTFTALKRRFSSMKSVRTIETGLSNKTGHIHCSYKAFLKCELGDDEEGSSNLIKCFPHSLHS